MTVMSRNCHGRVISAILAPIPAFSCTRITSAGHAQPRRKRCLTPLRSASRWCQTPTPTPVPRTHHKRCLTPLRDARRWCQTPTATPVPRTHHKRCLTPLRNARRWCQTPTPTPVPRTHHKRCLTPLRNARRPRGTNRCQTPTKRVRRRPEGRRRTCACLLVFVSSVSPGPPPT
jgi:hypothetical protein